MSVPTTTPPLLLTKRLNAFLHAHQTVHLPTLLLTTTHGKLLAHASSQPVSKLRTHATVAASLLAIHTSSSVAIPTALPGSRTPDPITSSPASPDLRGHEQHDEDDEQQGSEGSGGGEGGASTSASGKEGVLARKRTLKNAIKPISITVQLSAGTVIIRRLKCGLLFVCVGPPAHNIQDNQQQQQQHAQQHENGDGSSSSGGGIIGVGSPSEAESFISTSGQTTSSLESANAAPVVAMRRHATELAWWLDDKLGTLKVPEEGIGIVE